MTQSLLRALFIAEIILAQRLCALGDYWAANALNRLGKISGEHSRRRR